MERLNVVTGSLGKARDQFKLGGIRFEFRMKFYYKPF